MGLGLSATRFLGGGGNPTPKSVYNSPTGGGGGFDLSPGDSLRQTSGPGMFGVQYGGVMNDPYSRVRRPGMFTGSGWGSGRY